MQNEQKNLWRLILIAILLIPIALIGCAQKSSGTEDGTSESDDTTDGSASGSGTTTGSGSSGSTAASTAVSISGALALVSAVSGGSLVASPETLDTYWVKCITTDISDIKVCIDQCDANGAFDLSCDGFKEKRFGCFILTGTDAENLSIAGMITSDSLAIGDQAATASMAITFDPTTGSTSVEFAQADTSGEEVEIADIEPIAIPTALLNLGVKSGKYDLDSCQAKKSDVNAGTAFSGTAYKEGDQCKHHMKQRVYVKFNEGSEFVAPNFAMWRSEGDYAKCTTADGSIKYHISDGTNAYSTKKEVFDHTELLDLIITHKWAPDAAIKRFELSSKENVQNVKKDDGEDVLRTDVQTAYATATTPCTGFVDDFITSWATGTVETKSGRKTCKDVTWTTQSTVANSFLNDPDDEQGDLLSWCGQYRSAKSTDKKAKLRDTFIAQCDMFIAGEAGQEEESQAGIELVSEFLNVLAQERHEGHQADKKWDKIKEAYAAIDVATLSATDASQDDALAVLIKAWADQMVSEDWYDEAQHGDWIALYYAAGDSVAAVIPVEENDDGVTGRKFIVDRINEQKTQLELMACAGNPIDFYPLAANNIAAYNTFMGQIEMIQDDDNGGSNWKFKGSVSDKKAAMLAFLTTVAALTGDEKLPQCTTLEVQNKITALNNNESWINLSENLFFGWEAGDAKKKYLIKQLGGLLKDPNQDGSGPLKADGTPNTAYTDALADLDYTVLMAKIDEIIEVSPWMAYMKEDANRIKDHYSQAGKQQVLFGVTQSVSNMLAREAFQFDTDYLATLKKIRVNSDCLPDASVGHRPELDDDGKAIFNITVRSPVRRVMAGDIFLKMSLDPEEASDDLQIEDSRMQDEGSCFWGNIQRLANTNFNATTNILTGHHTEAWVNTCREGDKDDGGDDDSDSEDTDLEGNSENIQFRHFQLKLIEADI